MIAKTSKLMDSFIDLMKISEPFAKDQIIYGFSVNTKMP